MCFVREIVAIQSRQNGDKMSFLARQSESFFCWYTLCTQIATKQEVNRYRMEIQNTRLLMKSDKTREKRENFIDGF